MLNIIVYLLNSTLRITTFASIDPKIRESNKMVLCHTTPIICLKYLPLVIYIMEMNDVWYVQSIFPLFIVTDWELRKKCVHTKTRRRKLLRSKFEKAHWDVSLRAPFIIYISYGFQICFSNSVVNLK